MHVESEAYARAGLMGNPSDAYFGKALSVSISNFKARVQLDEGTGIVVHDHTGASWSYGNVADLKNRVADNGHPQAPRLMTAAIKHFADYCDETDVLLDDRGFSLSYESTIPERVGLAGSSALVTAALHSLMEFYQVNIPRELRPKIVLEAETRELGIPAGLMDRVIQEHEGCMFMDFGRSRMNTDGYGLYEHIDPAALPPLFVAYRPELAEASGVVHSDLRRRWDEGDPKVAQAMHDLAGLASAARDLICSGKGREIGPLMDTNFETRRSIMTVSPENVLLVECARSVGAHAKLAGSGGAVVGVYQDQAMFDRLAGAYEEAGTLMLRPEIRDPA